MQIPDTAFYMFLGYGVLFAILGLYIITLNQRLRKAKRVYRMMRELEDDRQESAQ